MMKWKAFVLAGYIGLSGCSSIIYIGQTPEDNKTAAETGLVAVDNLIVRGDEQRRRGQLDIASATLERAVRLAPRSPDVYVALSRVKLDAGQYSAAVQFAQKALSLFPSKVSWKQERARTEAQWVINEANKKR